MSLYGNLRAATYVAKDVALALKRPGLLLANAAHLALNNTWESQACRVARGRDYNAAVDRAAAPVDVEELLAEAEADIDSWGPYDLVGVKLVNGQIVTESIKDAGKFRDDIGRLQRAAQRMDEAFSVLTQQDSAASATADASPANPPAGDADPVAPSSPVPGATGSPNLVDLIAEVLADHLATLSIFNGQVRCFSPDARESHFECSSPAEWRAHVAPLIAERIEKATPPAPFTHGDLIEASKLIHAYSERMEAYGAWMFRARELANRLADAGHADPTP